jgi:hypothetical protein
MRRIRFTIASLLCLVLFVAVGFAALRESNDLWDNGVLFREDRTLSVRLAGGLVWRATFSRSLSRFQSARAISGDQS